MADNTALADLIEQTVARFGSIHGLVNNAGAHFRGKAETRTADELSMMVDVNLRAPIVLSRLVLPHLRRQGGFIVNVASLAGKLPLDGAATYSATKFGLRAFSLALAEELRGSNVSVSLVSPGPIDTGFIMDELDEVEDIVFSQTMCTADDVAQWVLDCAHDGRREIEFPVGGGKLATLGYLVPGLRRVLKPRLERKGARLGTIEPFTGTLDTVITASHLSDAEAQAQSEFVERLLDDGVHTGLLATAVHGGKIEANTDLQAERMATLLPGISTWICKGWRRPSGAFTRWHVDSAEVSPNSFPGLATIAGRGFDHVVSFHGMAGPGVLLGGCAPVELRELLRVAIIDAIGDLSIPVVVSGTDGPLSGVAPSNFVNWLSNGGHGGIQIEQSLVVRSLYWEAVTDAVASVLGPLL